MKNCKMSNIQIGGYGGSVDLELLEVQLGQLQAELEFLYRDNQEKESATSKYKEKIFELERSIRGLNWEKGNLKRILDEERRKSVGKRDSGLQDENEQLRAELEKERTSKILLEKEIATLKDVSVKHQAKQDAAVATTAIQNDFVKMRADLESALEENEMNCVQIQQLQTELQRLAEEIRNKDILLENLRSQVSTKNKKLKRLSEKKKAATTEIEAVANELANREREIVELKGRLERRSISKIIGKPFVRKASRISEEDARCINLIRDSELFDANWYVSSYEDVAKEGADPAEHYYYFGAREGRDPSPHFSTERYLATYRDVLRGGRNPLVHYLQLGRQSGGHLL